MTKKIKVCIFDLDGTLLNTLDGLNYYLNAVLSDRKIGAVTLEQTREIVGNGVRSLIRSALALNGVQSDDTVDIVLRDYEQRYNENPHRLVAPYDGIVQMLSELKACGVRLAVLSNKPDFAAKALVSRFFGNSFDVVCGGRDGMALKPSADAVFAILRRMGAQASECAFVGDSQQDVITAINADAALPVAVLWGFRTRDELFAAGARNFAQTPSQIVELIRSKNDDF